MLDPITLKNVFVSGASAGMVFAGIRAGLRKAREDNDRLSRQVGMLRKYKGWSHRAISVLIAFHRAHHPGEEIISDWMEETENGH